MLCISWLDAAEAAVSLLKKRLNTTKFHEVFKLYPRLTGLGITAEHFRIAAEHLAYK